MKLRAYLDVVADLQVRIGTDKGSGFIYIGTVAGFKNLRQKIHKQILRFHADRIASSVISQNKKGLEKALESYYEMLPIMEREIVEIYPTQYDTKIATIIVDGTEGWMTDDHMPPITEVSTKGAADLATAAYADVCEELVAFLAAKGKTPASRIKYLESWIRSDPYGLLSDPQAVIDTCYKRADEGGGPAKIYSAIVK